MLVAGNDPATRRQSALHSRVDKLVDNSRAFVPMLPLSVGFRTLDLAPDSVRLLTAHHFDLRRVTQIFKIPDVLVGSDARSAG